MSESSSSLDAGLDAEVSFGAEAEITKESVLSDYVPDHLWNLFPPNCMYLKEMMIFCGYETKDAVLSLKSEEELRNMFQFAIEMYETLSEEDKNKIFGIFSKKPENVRILPGFKSTFDKFLQALGEKPQRNENVSNVPELPLKRKSTQLNKVVSVKHTLEDVKFQMQKWLLKQEKAGKFKVKSVSFEVAENAKQKGFMYKCLICNWRTDILEESNGKIYLSNAQRHYRQNQCLKFKKKTVNDSKNPNTGIQKFFTSKSSDNTSDNPDFDRMVQNNEAIWTQNWMDAGEENDLSLMSESSSSSVKEVVSSPSKNVQAPAGGILGDIETSRRF